MRQNLENRGGKIGPTRWASPVRPELGRAGPLNYWPEKNRVKFGPAQYGPARPARIFFAFKRLFGQTSPVFRAGWAVKILAQKNRANFDPVRFWPSPLLARPSPIRPARLPALLEKEKKYNIIMILLIALTLL